MEKLLPLADELVKLPVDILVVVGTAAATAAHRATNTIPVVMVNVADPVGSGLIASLSHPGGNITGLTNGITSAALAGKRLQVVAALLPGLMQVAYIESNPDAPASALLENSIVDAAQRLGLQLHYFRLYTRSRVYSSQEIESTFDAAAGVGADALLVTRSGLALTHQQLIVDLAAKHRLPAMYAARSFAVGGGLCAFGSDDRERFARVAHYVDRILKGAAPGELPVEQPTLFELVINVKTAQSLGVTIPPEVAAQVMEWVQ